jgi:predicted nucleotidyltransferase
VGNEIPNLRALEMGKTDCDEIRSKLRQNLSELKARFGVRTLELFGSYVRHENGPDSDLDILVTFNRTPGLFRFIELENHLGDLLGLKVDLVLKNSLKPDIGRQVLAEALPL